MLKLDYDADNIAWLTIDKPDSRVNTIDNAMLAALHKVFQELQKGDKKPAALVILSGKSSGFIAGADISHFKNLTDAEQAREFLQTGHDVLQMLANLSFPTVALIQGHCLGGGLELALACDYRITSNDAKTILGLPEVKLGIHPGWAGSIRLPRLIGSLRAMDLILSGRTLQAKAAKRIGLTDIVVSPEYFKKAIASILAKKPRVSNLKQYWLNLTNNNLVRPLLGKMFLRKLQQKVKINHYPAPFAVIDNWVKFGVKSKDAFAQEINSVVNLVATDTARNLIRVFFLQERLKGLAKNIQQKITRVHVVGAGIMGGDIAGWCALKGLTVTIQDTNSKMIAGSLQRAKKLFSRHLHTSTAILAAQDRLQPDLSGNGISQADIIIEAVVEKLDVKQKVLQDITAKARNDAVIATNTSTIPLEELTKGLSGAERLVGIHFFNPVAKMPLVEIVSCEISSTASINMALSFVKTIGKLPLLVKSAPGFLVNRLLLPYMLESITLLEEGIPAAVIDRAAMDFGMPMGPIELADTVGLDVCSYAAAGLQAPIPDKLKELLARGHTGKKSGSGFYQYKNGQPIKQKIDNNYREPEDITDRLIMRILNEAVAALHEGIVADKDLLDAGMIFGTGFAPFTGGPMSLLQKEGSAQFKQRLDQLAESYGERFAATPGWNSI